MLLKMLPPDEQQVRIARAINLKLGGSPKVSFFRIATEDGGERYGMVLEFGAMRKTLQSDVPWYDADDVVRTAKEWAK